jgi:YVTN family beta-propeller protein
MFAWLAAAHAGTGEQAHRIYVTNERSGELSVIDGASLEVVATVPLGKRPRGLQFSADGRYLYVALSGSPIAGPGTDPSTLPPADKGADGIGVVDVKKLQLVRVLRGVSDPEQLAVGREGKRLYVASEDTGTALVFDAAHGKLLATLPVGGEPEGVARSPDGRFVYVTAESDDTIAVIDTARDELLKVMQVCARPRAIVFAQTVPRAYASCENDAAVAVLDVERHEMIARIDIPGKGMRPMGVALSPSEDTLFVTTGRGGTVAAVDTGSLAVRGSVMVGMRPWGIAVSPDGSTLYTANGPSNDVTVVATDGLRVRRKIAVGASPWGVVVQ